MTSCWSVSAFHSHLLHQVVSVLFFFVRCHFCFDFSALFASCVKRSRRISHRGRGLRCGRKGDRSSSIRDDRVALLDDFPLSYPQSCQDLVVLMIFLSR